MDDIRRELEELKKENEELKAANQKLREDFERVRSNEELYRVAMAMTDHTISVVDIKAHTLSQIYNEGDWTGITSTMEDAPETIIAAGIIHPDDCEGYRNFYKDIYAGVPSGSYTMRVIEENRGWVWFTMYYQTTFDENGTPVRAICFSDDITVEMKAKEKYEQYRAAITADADFVWEADITNDRMIKEEENFGTVFSDQDYVTYSSICEAAFNAIDDLAQRNIVMETFSREGLLKAFNEAKREVELEYQFDYKDGRGLRWIHSTAYLITNNLEDVNAIICTNDITESHNEMEALERKAERDSLTGIYNRYAFETRMNGTLRREPENIHGYLIMDVDNFKHYNDTYGHSFGDSVLIMIADVIYKSFRISDIVGRVGGDEFMVFMRGIGTRESLVARAEHVRNQLRIACENGNFPNVTLSIGGALSRPSESFQELYLEADKALYKSKEKGKDCFTLADEL